MIRIAIAEDDPLGVETLVAHLDRYRHDRDERFTIRAFPDGAALLQDYRPEWDLLLLDIEMPEVDGMSAARKIREVDPEVLIIFITSSPHYAVSGYEVGALSYVLKPVTYSAFASELTRVLRHLRSRERRPLLLTTTDGQRRRIDLAAIEHIESLKHQVSICTAEDRHVVATTMRALEEELTDQGFFRIHSGYLVNLQHVMGVEGSDARMRNGAVVPISRARKKDFLAALTSYIGSRGVVT